MTSCGNPHQDIVLRRFQNTTEDGNNTSLTTVYILRVKAGNNMNPVQPVVAWEL